MTDQLPTLHTRWSMLDQLTGADRDEAWRWFETTYTSFVHEYLGRHLRGERFERAKASFWGYLFTSNVFENADRNRRFRALLFGTMRNYLMQFQRDDHFAQEPDADHDESAPGHAQGREDFAVEDANMLAFADATLARALELVEAKAPRQAKVLRGFYAVGTPGRSVRDLAAELGIQLNALHQLLWRARRSLRRAFVAVIGHTVATADDLDDELRLMFEALGRSHPGLLDR